MAGEVIFLLGEPAARKWAMATDIYATDLNVVLAQALAECKAKGGTDAKIVGWSFDHPKNGTRAKEDCRKKGGQNPKTVARF